MKSAFNPSPSISCCLLLQLVAPLSAATLPAVFNVRDFGTAGDGVHLDTAGINKAIETCIKTGGGTVYLPPGRYLTGTIEVKSHVTLDLDAGATILGSENPQDYPACADPWGREEKILSPLISANGAQNITLTGRGTIDGQGQVWWKRHFLAHPRRGMSGATTPEEIEEAKKVSLGRPHLIRLVKCKDVVIEKLNLKDSPEWTVHPLFCEFVRIEGVTIQNRVPSPNTDGINPQHRRNIQMLHS